MVQLVLRRSFPALALFFSLSLFSQQTPPSADNIYEGLQRLATTGTVLYIAAHPDDENSRLIAYLENGEHIRTGYLALNRGSGGQNLIGPEKGAAMGVIRTQELLEARKIDGGQQFFTRAVDFGYSKSPGESFQKWDRQKLLSDVVWVMRKFQPDIIITRFPGDGSGGHGHHTASAILAKEAFELAGDPDAFSGQLNYLDTWQPKRLYFNSSSWWDKDLPKKAKDSDDYVVIDIGQYNPVLGQSYNEIAAKGRSQHRSQGFGAEIDRGSQLEYLKYVKGDRVPADSGLFAGIEDGMSRYWPGGKKLDSIIAEAIENFKIQKPSGVYPYLARYEKALRKMPDNPVKARKFKSVHRLMTQVAGLYVEATAGHYQAAPGDSVNVSLYMVSRGKLRVTLESARVLGNSFTGNDTTVTNEPLKIQRTVAIPGDQSFSTPYWLRKPYTAMYKTEDQQLIGLPETPPAILAHLRLNIDGTDFTTPVPVRYKWVDRSRGQRWRDFEVLPPATVNFDGDVMLFSQNKPKPLKVSVAAHGDNISGTVRLNLPDGWRAEPSQFDFDLEKRGDKQAVNVDLQPTSEAVNGRLKAVAEVDGKAYSKSFQEIAYEHIETQVLLPFATLPVRKLNVKVQASTVGYIPGSGDDIPAALKLMGVKVVTLDPANLNADQLNPLDAVVIGIRAYNVEKSMRNAYEDLMAYVKQGGTMVAQYSKSYGLKTKKIGPYPITLSHNRVTVEEAPARLLKPNNPVFTTPNQITDSDFEGWVQERGLYFASEWDSHYTPLISWHDPGEKPVKGGLLATDYGKGKFIYTGISFFRELPAGVPGAYRFFANLISYGNDESP